MRKACGLTQISRAGRRAGSAASNGSRGHAPSERAVRRPFKGCGRWQSSVHQIPAVSLVSPPLPSFAMLSVRAPLATIADQQQLQLSPLKRLTLADKENTVRGGPGAGGGSLCTGRPGVPGPREGGGCLPTATHPRVSPYSPRPSAAPASWPARLRGESSRTPPSW